MSELSPYRHSARARRLLRSLVPVIGPPGIERMGDGGDIITDVVDDVERAMASMPSLIRVALVSGMTAYDVASVAYPKSRGRMAHALAGDAAKAYFGFWAHGTALQKNFVKGIKGLVGMSCYEMPAVLDSIGYTPKAWIDKVGERRLRVYRDEIAAHEDHIFDREPIPLPSEVAARVAALPDAFSDGASALPPLAQQKEAS